MRIYRTIPLSMKLAKVPRRCNGINILESVLEPLDSLLTLDLVGGANVGLAATALGNTLTRSGPKLCQRQSCQSVYIVY